MSKEERLRHIIDEIFTIAQPGSAKDALWHAYQSIKEVPDSIELSIEGINDILLQLTLQLNHVQSTLMH